MSESTSVSSWRDTIFNACAEFINYPSDTNIGRLHSLLSDYRRFYKQQPVSCFDDEHEQVMNYR